MLDTKLSENAYVTLCDIKYLSRALTLINSIRNTGNNSDIVLLALDRDSEKALQLSDTVRCLERVLYLWDVCFFEASVVDIFLDLIVYDKVYLYSINSFNFI